MANICFWLIEIKFAILIAACNTFRAGAIVQLRTRIRRLYSLHPPQTNHANCDIDVVPIDTAGRIEDNEPLMRALSKLISVRIS
jgi:signal recognition particle receptor subunit alpha